MVFSSIAFLFVFLPVALTLYLLAVWAGQRLVSPTAGIRAGNAVILAASLLFYFIGEAWLIVILLASSLTDFTAGLLISGAWRRGPIRELTPGADRTSLQRAVLAGSIAVNLGILFFFKYFNFSVGLWNDLAAAGGAGGLLVEDIARITLPLGISFYTFQSMSYTIDVYRGHTRATRNPLDFACYVTMFPQLVAGPIVRYADVAAALVRRVIDPERFLSGIQRFLIGLCKKVLIANTVAGPVDAIFALPPDQLSCGLAWLGVVGYALQIYFDFSGYSDMAIGLGRMMGFAFVENFAHPYAARSLRDFWRRWHISLSTWFRDYLYVPLGGNRYGPVRTGVNLLIVFVLCGLWHGAELTFVAWGLWHGLFLAMERMPRWAEVLRRRPTVGHGYTLLVVLLGWVLFRSGSFAQALCVFRAMLGLHGGVIADSVWRYLTPDVGIAGLAGALFSLPVTPIAARAWGRLVARGGRRGRILQRLGGIVVGMVLGALAFLSVCALSGSAYNPFIYFRF